MFLAQLLLPLTQAKNEHPPCGTEHHSAISYLLIKPDSLYRLKKIEIMDSITEILELLSLVTSSKLSHFLRIQMLELRLII